MNKYINNLNPYVFAVVWIILLGVLADVIPTMLTAASTIMNIGSVIAVAIFMYLLTVGYKYWTNRFEGSRSDDDSKKL